jgi:hypothetical protein
MSTQADEKKPDLKELARILSDAYYSILQCHNLAEDKVKNEKKKFYNKTYKSISNDSSQFSTVLDYSRLESTLKIQQRFTNNLVYSTIH